MSKVLMASTSIGVIISISSSSVTIRLSQKVNSGLLVLEGRTHKVGQVGSFVRIPQGYNDLYGVVGSSNENSIIDYDENVSSDNRTIIVELIGESSCGFFDRGISQYPSVGDDVHMVLDSDLKVVYGSKSENLVTVGKLASSESIDVNLDIDKLVTRHSAVVGSTGSGKSTSVSGLLRSICKLNDKDNNSARILLVDMHGEYSSALKDISKVFSVEPSNGEHKLNIPFWALPTEKLIDFLCGNINETSKNSMIEFITECKKESLKSNGIEYINESKITSFTPLPYNLNKLWYKFVFDDTVTYSEKEFINPAYKDNIKGDPLTLAPPKFIPPGTASNPPFKKGNNVLTKQLNLMKARLLDSQYSFFLSPDGYTPDENGKVANDLDQLLNEWLNHDKPISILDLSGMPSNQLDMLLGSIMSIVFEASLWGRNLSSGLKKNPVLFVLEEAHRYLSNHDDGLTKSLVQRVAKEGRKFGVGLMIISQRPSEVDDTILSQCGTLFALRLTNSSDRSKVKAAMSDGLSSLIDSLPILRTGEAIIIGEAAKLPSRCKFKLPPDGHYPDSQDPDVSKSWSKSRDPVKNYSKLIEAWRLNKPMREDK
ncbi:ATP-binding protein [Citrobacter sedlakii]|uniref:ATP-binding protein n=1 Tax=Citrobacter TaxID=544 RepID=UPI00196A11C5|nr:MULTISPECIES: ATP-binding protein [Citrobacter]MBM9567124.1 ATP-binding protein [Citrobacter sedlakii]HBL4692611.1 ATP-binding protein [Citrobacter sedlakii]HBL4707050.1 ATP-binding protein [Citrobacter sedlakii]HBL4718468.1 ATP-binding protein [Citrobacter sedlakii]HCA7839420.1 ATP-binding protein [Citrobacter sedlakii]